MQAYQLTPGVAGLEALTLTTLRDPAPGPGQVLVRMRAASLNYRDNAFLRGGFRTPLARPTIPLSDGAGEIVAVGEGVTRLRPGDRVATVFSQPPADGPAGAAPSSLGVPLDGVLAELMVLHEAGLALLPPSYDFRQGATLTCAGSTAWNALFAMGTPLRLGQSVLVQGSGGVSVWALQLARAAGARVIATTSHDAKADQLRSLGAAEVINYVAHPDWDQEVLRLTGGAGVDCVIEVGGAGTLARSYAAVGRGGKVCLIGVLTNWQDGHAAQPAPANPLILSGKAASLHGIGVGRREMLEQMAAAVEISRIVPVIDCVFPFAEAPAAFAYAASGAFVGKVVIEI